MLFGAGRVGRQMPAGGLLQPSLDLGFSSGVLDPRITFTRAAGPATYFDVAGVLQTAGTNVARFDYDPVTHAARGLLLEEARTNYALQSGAMSVAPWVPGRATLTGSAFLAPDGTTTATRVVEDSTAANTHYTGATPASIPVNAPVTYSVYIRDNTRRYCSLALYDNTTSTNNVQANIDLTAGTIVAVAPGGVATTPTVSIIPLSGGWYRCTITSTLSATATTGVIIRVLLCNSLGGVSYSGDGASNLYVWGAQAEAGAFATSYIPTTAASVARAIDTASMPLDTWYNPSQSTIILSGMMPQLIPAAATQAGFVVLDDGTNNNRVILRASSPAACQAVYTVASVATITATAGNFVAGVPFKLGGSFLPAGLSTALNGAAVNTGPGTAPVGLTTMRLGRNNTTAFPMNGYISRLQYYPRALSAAELQAATV